MQLMAASSLSTFFSWPTLELERDSHAVEARWPERTDGVEVGLELVEPDFLVTEVLAEHRQRQAAARVRVAQLSLKDLIRRLAGDVRGIEVIAIAERCAR
eukprot:TRINITY_DN60601_c0_g1_i2.p1 TRINITY_DN60601_c0_g1~~TRINITY_DN60601_c0_g1_i2.p1  ORF type:complete len:100 (+),score=0.59 TRINITY_DN60601_c0_g1_i2:264-563(+)